MSFFLENKLKIITSVGAVSTVAVGASVTTTLSKNEEENKPNKEEEIMELAVNDEPEVPSVQPAKTIVKRGTEQKLVPKANVGAKLADLKDRKGKMSQEVDIRITESKAIFKNSSHSTLRVSSYIEKCESKDEVGGITEQEKKAFNDFLNAVKADISKYEKVKGKIDGELRDKESYADGDNTNEDRYKEFETKFNEVEKEYKDINNQNHYSDLTISFHALYEKLMSTHNTCVFKDVIKINNRSAIVNK